MQKRIFQFSLVFVVMCATVAVRARCADSQQLINNELATSSTQDDVTANDIARLREQLPADNENLVADVEAILQRAEANLKQAEIYKQDTGVNQISIDGVESLAKSIQQSDPKEPVLSEDWQSSDMAGLQRLVQDQESATNESVELAEKANTDLTQRIARRQQIREKLLIDDQSADELRLRIRDLEPGDDWVAKANLLDMKAKVQSLEQETRAQNSELALLDAEDRVDLPQLKADFLKQQSASRQATLDQMHRELNHRRAETAAETERQTQLSKLGEVTALKDSFEKNVKLAEDNRVVAGEIADTESQLKGRRDELKKLKDQFNETKSRVKQIGLSDSIGAMLRDQKDQLPTPFALSMISHDDDEFKEVQFQLFDVTQQLQSLTDQTIRAEVIEAGKATAVELETLKQPISQLTSQRSELLDATEDNLGIQYEQLIVLELVNSQMDDLVKEYRSFINERILWIRSNKVLFTSMSLDASDRSVMDSNQWARLGKLIGADWNRNPWTYLFCLGGILALLLLKPRMRKAVDQFGVEASRGSCTSFWPTSKSWVLSTLLALIYPSMMLFVGWRLQQATAINPEYGRMIPALGNALLVTSWFAIPVEILKRLSRKSGLGHQHFNWSNEGVQTIRTNLSWASPLGSLIVFGVAFFYFVDTRHQNDLVERILFLAGMVVLATVLYRCLNPQTGVFRSYLRQHEGSWANQLSFLWFGMLVAVPVMLGLLAVIGYFYTSLNLAICVFMTFVFGLVIEISRALLMRFILLRRRHAHIELARRRRKALREESKKQGSMKQEPEGQGELAAAVSNKSFSDSELLEGFNVDENATQSRKLIALSLGVIWFLGLWLIWTDVLPALRALDRYPVWPPGATAEVFEHGGLTDSGKETSTSADKANVDDDKAEELTVITIRDLLVFFLIAMITYVLARNLPGLIEMTFLNHLPVEPSVRYASKSILSYLIILVGAVLAFRSVQVGWAQVQWLATALTFGLAFGLQEIFANFVAGIILLFERPLRIGDVVTVDDVTGVVTKIRTRATTISNWDRKEYVIPNKEFITGRVLNWTLSDQVNRIVIQVGVAYGSDIELAKSVLLEICQGHPLTMEKPGSSVSFEQFGDSSLMLNVRTFVPDVNCRLTVIDQLHTEINQAFTNAGIEISFPQMDLHIRSADDSLLQSLKS